MIASIRLRASHVIVAFVASAALVAAFLAFGAAQTSGNPVNAGVPLSAPLQEPIPAHDGYKGWGQVVAAAEFTGYRHYSGSSVTAWRWTGYAWQQNSRYYGERVYIYPYATGWSWTWTQSKGWLAMRTNSLIIGYRPIAIAT